VKLAGWCDDEVRWLDVSVDDAAPMKLTQGGRRPDCNGQEDRQLAWSADVPRKKVATGIVYEQRRLAVVLFESARTGGPRWCELAAQPHGIFELRYRCRDFRCGWLDDKQRLASAHAAEDEKLSVVLERLQVWQCFRHPLAFSDSRPSRVITGVFARAHLFRIDDDAPRPRDCTIVGEDQYQKA